MYSDSYFGMKTALRDSDQLQQDNEAQHIHQISEKESQTKQQKMLSESLRLRYSRFHV
jgi:hypothetical protein